LEDILGVIPEVIMEGTKVDMVGSKDKEHIHLASEEGTE
jgi:hypothetical protein